MGPPSYIRSIVDRNVVLRRITVSWNIMQNDPWFLVVWCCMWCELYFECVCITRHNADCLPCYLVCTPREYGVEFMSGVDQFTYLLCKRSQGSLMTRVTALNGWTLDALIDLTASDGLLRRIHCVTCRKVSFIRNCSNLNILWEATLLRMVATVGLTRHKRRWNRRNGERLVN